MLSSCGSCGCLDVSCEPCVTPTVCNTCDSCCCDDAHGTWRRGRILRGVRVEYLSNLWMSVEVAGAVLAGVLAGSLALIAFGADSSIEFVSGVAVLKHLRSDYKGEGMLGPRTAVLTTALLFGLIPIIGGLGVYSYVSGIRPEGSPLGIAIAVGAVILMPLLFIEKRKIGRETRSLSISIDAYATATCLLLSVALLGGLLGVYLTGYGWIDYLATGLILGFVAKEAVESLNETRADSDGPTLNRDATLGRGPST